MQSRLSDEQLLAQFCNGCSESFSEIITRYEQKIFSSALYLTNSEEDAEEVMGVVFSAMHQQLQSESTRIPLFDWLISKTLDACVSRLMQRERNQGEEAPSPAIENNGEFAWPNQGAPTLAGYRHAISHAAGKLPLSLKFVFLLRDVQGLTMSKIAAILGTNVFEIRTRLHQARLHVREELQSLQEQRHASVV